MDKNTITVSVPHSDQAESHAKDLIRRMGTAHPTNVLSGAFVHIPQREGNVTIAFFIAPNTSQERLDMAQTLATEYGEIVPGNLDDLLARPGQRLGGLAPFLWAAIQ